MRRPWSLVPASHEVGANLHVTTDDLTVFETLGQVGETGALGKVADRARRLLDSDEDDGPRPLNTGSFEYDGRIYAVTLRVKQSGLEPLNGVHGAMVAGESAPEYLLHIRPEDGVGDDSDDTRTFILSPRWPGMRTAEDEPMSYNPNRVGFNARVHGVNEPLDAYPELLWGALEAFGIDTRAMTLNEDTSPIWSYEKYARIARNRMPPLVSDGGVLDRLDKVTTSDRGTDKPHRDNRGVEGRLQTATVPSSDAGALYDGHTVGSEVKAYHPKLPRSDETAREGDDPLAHAKLCVRFSKGDTVSDGDDPMLTDNGAVRWSHRDELERELDERVLSLLSWAGLPTRAEGNECYIPDAYFEATDAASDREVHSDPTREQAEEQASLMGDLLNTETRPSDSGLNVLHTVADGGRQMHIDEVMERASVSESTVYEQAGKSRLFEVRDRMVRIVTEAARQAFDEARPLVSKVADGVEGAADRVRGLLGGGGDGEDDEDAPANAFEEKCREWGVTVEDGDEPGLTIRLGRMSGGKAKECRADLRGAWIRDGREIPTFDNADIKFHTPDGNEGVLQGELPR